MKLNSLSLSLGLAISTLFCGTAMAADWNYGAGSIKDVSSAAVPVPAPVPIPEYAARYYFRADIGVGFGDAPDSSEAGYYYGADAEHGPYGMQSSWLNDDFDTFVTMGVGVGINIGDRFRADFTAETRTKEEVKIDGQYAYNSRNVRGQWDEVRGTVKDKTSLSGGVFLFNGYYDFNRGGASRFTPYIGGGLGFAWNEMKRVHNTIENSRTCREINQQCDPRFSRRDIAHNHDKTHDMSFAAALMAGVGYRMSDSMLLDLNYRYLFIDSTDHGFGIPGSPGRQFGGDTKVSIGETHEHQIRAGIRFEVN